MEAADSFNYADYCRQRQPEEASSEALSEAPSEAPSEGATEDVEENDHVYTYVATREPDPAKDAQPVTFAYYPQYAYAYPHVQAPAQIFQQENVQTYVPVKSPKTAAACTPVVQPIMAYATHPAFAYGYAMPNYPGPVKTSSPKHSAAPARTTEKKKKPAEKKPAEKKPAEKEERSNKVWVGRTKKQVDEDNIKIAINEGIYNPNDIVPKGAKADQLFWCVEADGSNTLRTFQTIESGVLGKGVWKIDPRYGNAYFVRAKEEKEKK